VSFGREETFLLLLSLRKLVEERNLKSVRLWGKILGTQADYYVVEAETKDGARDEAQLESTANKSEGENDRDAEGAGGEEGEEGGDRPSEAPRRYQEIGCADEDGNVHYWFEPGTVVPRPKQPVTPVVPPEIGTGSNKYTYYVCNIRARRPVALPSRRDPGKAAGCAQNPQIVSYPPFNGSEAQYLRCQIARISAATVISPAGYYTFDSEDQDAEEAEGEP
ncbi:MAG: radial spokehead-like protein, partial [Olpidium bornovanus]